MAAKEQINGDGASATNQADEKDYWRKIALQKVKDAFHSTILGQADLHQYREEVLSDRALAISGFNTHAQQVKAIKEMADQWIPELIVKSRLLENNFEKRLENAKDKKWIGKKSMENWMKRLRNANVYYYKKKLFLESPDKFPAFLKNWERVAGQRKRIMEDPEFKNISKQDVKQLDLFLNEEKFLDLPFKNREELAATVHAALLAQKRKMPTLYRKAKDMLQKAANEGIMSKAKIGTWLERIFKSQTSLDNIEKFLNNQGPMPLQHLIANWRDAKQHFDKIEEERKIKGTPRGFHFVKLDVFLNWTFEQRKTYLQQAEYGFNKAKYEPSLFSKIRHTLAAKDWLEAEELIEQAKRDDATEPMDEESRKSLQSMEKFLREHGSKKPKPKESKSKGEVLLRIHKLLSQIPPSLRQMYLDALQDGYQAFWTFTTLMYNRVWCHQHGLLTKKREFAWEQNAEQNTKKRMKYGHPKRGTVANKVEHETGHYTAIRDQQGVRGAQFVFMDPHSKESRESVRKRNRIHENTRDYWYWTSIIPQGIQYDTHEYVVSYLHPEIKKLAREMESMGVRYPADGNVVSSMVLAQERQASKADAEPQYAMPA